MEQDLARSRSSDGSGGGSSDWGRGRSRNGGRSGGRGRGRSGGGSGGGSRSGDGSGSTRGDSSRGRRGRTRRKGTSISDTRLSAGDRYFLSDIGEIILLVGSRRGRRLNGVRRHHNKTKPIAALANGRDFVQR